MYKSTFQQILLFLVTTILIFKTGKYMVQLNDINSFFDFGVIAIFFFSFILFMNYFVRLANKLFRGFSF